MEPGNEVKPGNKAKIAILASGSGSNAQAIWRHFGAENSLVEVAYIGCNRPPHWAGIYERAAKDGLPVERFNRADLEGGALRRTLEGLGVQWVALAGFLMHIPPAFIEGFPDQILNIHPSLLPRFGGQGMWGMNVHEAVHAAALAEPDLRESGMTIHRVNAEYDKGEIVFQASVAIHPAEDDAEAIAQKVLALEHRYYPLVLEHLLTDTPFSPIPQSPS